MQGYSIPETTRAYGAVLLNADGEEFTDSLGPRDAVSQAIVDEVEKGKGVETPVGRPAVYLDTTRIFESDANVSLPYMLRRYRAGGIDPLREQLLTYPVLHYQNGGLVIDANAETTVEGVYACGEIAGGTHGRNRMMGNSLLECCVFGRRAQRGSTCLGGARRRREGVGPDASCERRRDLSRHPLRIPDHEGTALREVRLHDVGPGDVRRAHATGPCRLRNREDGALRPHGRHGRRGQTARDSRQRDL